MFKMSVLQANSFVYENDLLKGRTPLACQQFTWSARRAPSCQAPAGKEQG